jgi:wobble nucleotide-excising tRNase
MKLKAIKLIKNYKSFKNYTWQSFFNNQEFHKKINIFYGENGSGKSSICNLLKNVSQNKQFAQLHNPEEIMLLFNDGENRYSSASNKWNSIKKHNDIIFFDREFVDRNIHLGHNRNSTKGGQEQESGKMIIEFDSEAIQLRKLREKYRIEKDTHKKEVDNFNNKNKEILNFSLLKNEIEFYTTFKDKSKDEINKIKKELLKSKKDIENILETDQTTFKKVDDIQNKIKEIKIDKINMHLSDLEYYQAVFTFDIKEQVMIQAEKNLIKKLKHTKDFFELGFKIRETHPNQCPFCQSTNEEKNIIKIIRLYNEIFDDTYKEQFQNFITDKLELTKELLSIKQKINDFDLTFIFLSLKKIDENYKMKDIYLVDEEKLYKKPSTKKIDELNSKLSKLKKPNNEDITNLFDDVKKEFKIILDFFEKINKYVSIKNELIVKYKLENTDVNLQNRVLTNSQKITDITKQITFFNEKKIDNQRKKEIKEKEQEIVQNESNLSKERYEKVKTEYETYCSTELFTKSIKKIEEYFHNFNFNFKLVLKTEKTGNKTEFPFAFKVLDSESNERDLYEGLSEGELQVLSLCFFFAFLDIQIDRGNKILVFDDPITSLDNSNLSCLVDLIVKEQINFSQTFIFTHHRTFFKFLRKSFSTGKKKNCLGNEYNIFRNQKELGGSFICKSSSTNFKDKLKNFESNIYDKAKKGEAINAELAIVEYGQYLRYEVEKFIKNDLLFWHADNNFSIAIKGIKENKEKISNDDLDEINNIYSFCNWTTSHVDVGDDHGLQQLKDQIKVFLRIVDCT